MWIAVMGLMMLAGGLVRERGGGFDDFGWRGGEQTASNGTDSGTAVTVIAGPPVGTVSMSGGDEAEASISTQAPVDGAWDVACESKRGHRMVTVDDYNQFGCGQMIWKLDGGYFTASDPRRDGQAVGF